MKICKTLTTFEQCLYFLLTAKNSCGSKLVLLKLDKRKLLNAHLLETTFNTNCNDWSRYLQTKTSKTYKELEPGSTSTTATLATKKQKAKPQQEHGCTVKWPDKGFLDSRWQCLS